jgi:hypothetical protein
MIVFGALRALNERVAIVAFPAASVPLTRNVYRRKLSAAGGRCVPAPVHGRNAAAPVSIEHSNTTPASGEEKRNVGRRFRVGPLGPLSM